MRSWTLARCNGIKQKGGYRPSDLSSYKPTPGTSQAPPLHTAGLHGPQGCTEQKPYEGWPPVPQPLDKDGSLCEMKGYMGGQQASTCKPAAVSHQNILPPRDVVFAAIKALRLCMCALKKLKYIHVVEIDVGRRVQHKWNQASQSDCPSAAICWSMRPLRSRMSSSSSFSP